MATGKLKVSCIGLRDKHYWRPGMGTRRHCFVKVFSETTGRPFFESLCGQASRRGVGTQAVARPMPELRCARCDIEEMRLRGWNESGPETI